MTPTNYRPLLRRALRQRYRINCRAEGQNQAIGFSVDAAANIGEFNGYGCDAGAVVAGAEKVSIVAGPLVAGWVVSAVVGWVDE